MISNKNKRLTITLSKEDFNIVQLMCKEMRMTPSRFLRLTLNMFMGNLLDRLNKDKDKEVK